MAVEDSLVGVVDRLFGGGFFAFVGLWSRGARRWFIAVVGMEPGDFFSQDGVVRTCYSMPMVVPEADEDATCIESSEVVITVDE